MRKRKVKRSESQKYADASERKFLRRLHAARINYKNPSKRHRLLLDRARQDYVQEWDDLFIHNEAERDRLKLGQ